MLDHYDKSTHEFYLIFLVLCKLIHCTFNSSDSMRNYWLNLYMI